MKARMGSGWEPRIFGKNGYPEVNQKGGRQGAMKTREKILHYVRKKPMSTAEEITTGLGINYKTVTTLLSTLKRKGMVKATDSWPTKYELPLKETVKWDNGWDFMDYVELKRKYDELRAENNRLRAEVNEYRKKLARLAQRILRENI